jgi:hypothetical protein
VVINALRGLIMVLLQALDQTNQLYVATTNLCFNGLVLSMLHNPSLHRYSNVEDVRCFSSDKINII